MDKRDGKRFPLDLNFMDAISEDLAVRPNNFVPVESVSAAAKQEGPLKLCSFDTSEHCPAMWCCDLLVRPESQAAGNSKKATSPIMDEIYPW